MGGIIQPRLNTSMVRPRQIGESMKKLFCIYFVSTVAVAQTTFFSDQYGMPTGSATRSGDTTFYNDSYGMPQGSSQRSGNTTFFSNEYGMPVGSAVSPSQVQPLPSLPPPPQMQPFQPLQPLRGW